MSLFRRFDRRSDDLTGADLTELTAAAIFLLLNLTSLSFELEIIWDLI